jgi:hypothetical protein
MTQTPQVIWVIKSRRMRWAAHVACTAQNRNAYSIFVGKLEGKRVLGRPRHRWENAIKMDLQAIGWTILIWIRTWKSGRVL